MKRIRWNIEEAVALYSLYNESGFPINKERLEKLSQALNRRADALEIVKDEKFRNVAGLNMQSACIEYVVTNGKFGLSSVNKLFYDVNDLYKNNKKQFDCILNEFIKKYGDF